MTASSQQWFDQSDYDLDTVAYMLDGRRFFYAVFMMHLAVEKALKGGCQLRSNNPPPPTPQPALSVAADRPSAAGAR